MLSPDLRMRCRAGEVASQYGQQRGFTDPIGTGDQQPVGGRNGHGGRGKPVGACHVRGPDKFLIRA